MNSSSQDKTWRWHLPMLGQRIVKTAVAVFLCLAFSWLRGYRGQDVSTEAAITAIICMQPYVRDSRDFALNRFAGSLIGAGWGLLFILLFMTVPALSSHLLLLYAVMALGILISLYTPVLIRKPDLAGLAAIVFICVVIAFPDIEQPLVQAGKRFLGVLVGTVAAITVNVFRLPREKNRDKVFFVRTSDLAPDRFSHIPSAALFRLNYLYQDGARICLMSEHAPAFFSLQMSEAKINVPLIVMDGAAIYDPNENSYLYAETVRPANSARMRAVLDKMGVSYFIYTIHKNKTCIFHHGPLTPQEKVIFDRMKGSPYRSYLDEENYAPEEIVYFKILGEHETIRKLAERLQSEQKLAGFRMTVRVEAGAPTLSGLYLYAEKATMKHAEEHLMEMLRQENSELKPVEVFLRNGYRTEHDAMALLHTLENYYEPVKLFRRKKKGL